MTTAEIFGPLILNGMFAVMGSFATLGAFVVKELTVLDADSPEKGFQKEPSKKGRNVFILFFIIAPFVLGGVWGLLHTGALAQSINEPSSYAIAIIVGIVANSMVLKLNGLSAQAVIDLIKNNVPRNNA